MKMTMQTKNESEKNQKIAIIDLGGQYAHMIGRRLRDFGANYKLVEDVDCLQEDPGIGGFILSGGPQSVYADNAPTVPDWITSGAKPVLGICYGHQLLAKKSGLPVSKGEPEFGPAKIQINPESELFYDVPKPDLTVWMSHNDSVSGLGDEFSSVARSERCPVAAYENKTKRKYGVQFHPEVDHTEYGHKVLENFVRRVCRVEHMATIQDQIEFQIDRIKREAAGRKIFFFVSGGVDSMVAFTLCARAVGHKNVRAVYVDTGFMRSGESSELKAMFESLGLSKQLTVLDESKRFFDSLKDVYEPEEKRAIIGRAFVQIQAEQLSQLDTSNWVLGQGTIYPDTVESGDQGKNTAKIKTHHNRCEEVIEMIQSGNVIEPIHDFYKDEVRAIGSALGLDKKMVGRWPFPGPGLAIRCLCSQGGVTQQSFTSPDLPEGVSALRFPVSSVGVQGDDRTYLDAVALYGKLTYDQLSDIALSICNNSAEFNRVVHHLAGVVPTRRLLHKECYLDEDRVKLLRSADRIVKECMLDAGAYDAVWQFPVVLVPLSSNGKDESVVLRPVNSKDGMTANFARLHRDLLTRIAHRIVELNGVDAVYLDVSDKPPATIEWE